MAVSRWQAQCKVFSPKAVVSSFSHLPLSPLGTQMSCHSSLALYQDDIANFLQGISRSWSNDLNLFSRIPSSSLKLPLKQLKRKYYTSGHRELTLKQIPSRSSQHKPLTSTLIESQGSGLNTAWLQAKAWQNTHPKPWPYLRAFSTADCRDYGSRVGPGDSGNSLKCIPCRNGRS